MSITQNQDIGPNLLTHKSYNLAIKNSQRGTTITMFLLTPYFYTKYLPKTCDILESNLPQVLRTQCFNDSNLPFHIEVRNTEMGHLFEHIILEYLCQIKIRNGFNKASFKGITNWNWKKDARGTFHIKIQTEPEDIVFFDFALKKSVALFNKILLSKNSTFSDLVN